MISVPYGDLGREDLAERTGLGDGGLSGVDRVPRVPSVVIDETDSRHPVSDLSVGGIVTIGVLWLPARARSLWCHVVLVATRR